MEEQKRENKEELQQETAEEKNSGQGNSSTRSSLLPTWKIRIMNWNC